jgi:hypothetical protein
MPPEHVGPMRRAYFPRILVQSPPRMLSPEHFLSMRGVLPYPRGVLGEAVPGTQKAHDGQGTGVSEGREDQEVSDVGA